MRFTTLVTAALAVTATIPTALPAQANDVFPFVCTPSGDPDGVSRMINFNGALSNDFGTVANGNSIAGIHLLNISSKNGLGFESIQWRYRGTANKANGPWITVNGKDQDGNAVSYTIPMVAAAVIQKGVKPLVGIGPSQLGVPKDTKMKVTEIIFQNFPTAQASDTLIQQVRLDGLQFTLNTSTGHGCPGGTVHP